METTRLAVCYCVHDDAYYLKESILSFSPAASVYVFVSRQPWNDAPGEWEEAMEMARQAGAEVILGDWPDETSHRAAARAWLQERQYTHALIPDGDEIIEPGLLAALVKVAEGQLAERVTVEFDTYWKSPEYVIRPREAIHPMLLIALGKVENPWIRSYAGGRALHLSADYGVVHHLSYVGPERRIARKIRTWSHRPEIVPGWWESVWQAWDTNRLLRNLHPTHPPAYGFTERIHVPSSLRGAFERWQALTQEELSDGSNGDIEAGKISPQRASRTALAGQFTSPSPQSPASNPPRVSVVIPLHGGEQDIVQCLDSLEHCRDLLHEVVVVDDRSPDAAPDKVREYDWVRLVANDGLRGFSATCNRGYTESTGELVLFLNSDTVVPRAGLERLIAALDEADDIGAVGPYTNNAGYGQAIVPTYTTLDSLDPFAEDFAAGSIPDTEVDMLVGFCVLVRRRALEQVGVFDTRFGIGSFEDNDLSYRLRRAGYRLILAGRSYIHHHGSRSISRAVVDYSNTMARNAAHFRWKWRDDLDSGFASHLAGDARELIRFDPSKRPGAIDPRLMERTRQAGVTLCILAAWMGAPLDDALESASPYVAEVLVGIRAGDRSTREAAERQGAQVVEIAPEASEAEARHRLLELASGDWVLWLEPGERLARSSGEMLLSAVVGATPEFAGFALSICEEPAPGDAGRPYVLQHLDVRLFRRESGLRFVGRACPEVVLEREHRLEALAARIEGTELFAREAVPSRRRELLINEAQEGPVGPRLLFHLGRIAILDGQFEDAVRRLRAYFAVTGISEPRRRDACLLLSDALQERGLHQERLALLQYGAEFFPDDPDLLALLGDALVRAGSWREAEDVLRRALGLLRVPHTGDLPRVWVYASDTLARLYARTGRYPEAKHRWIELLNRERRSARLTCAFLEAASEVGDFFIAQDLLARLYVLEGVSETWVRLGAALAERTGGTEQKIAWLRNAVEQHRGAVAPRLALARHLLQGNREVEAFGHLSLLAEAGIAEAAYYLGLMSRRRGDAVVALFWMEQALSLAPEHAETREQVRALQAELAARNSIS